MMIQKINPRALNPDTKRGAGFSRPVGGSADASGSSLKRDQSGGHSQSSIASQVRCRWEAKSFVTGKDFVLMIAGTCQYYTLVN